MRIRNLRDGEWEIPDLNLVVGAEPFDVDDPAVARNLLEQEGNYAPVDDESHALVDEIAAARERHNAVAVVEDVGELGARELIASLDTMSEPELRDLRAQEIAGKNRKTVVARIDELLATGEGQEG